MSIGFRKCMTKEIKEFLRLTYVLLKWNILWRLVQSSLSHHSHFFSTCQKISTIKQNATETQIPSVLFHNKTSNINMAPTYSFQETPQCSTRGGQAVEVQTQYQIGAKLSVLLSCWCQIVYFVVLVPNFPFCNHGAKLSVLTLGVKLSAFNSWCQIVQCQIVQDQIVQY